jgi:hypothetical protein
VRFVCELFHDLRLNVLHVLQKITPPLRHLSEARAPQRALSRSHSSASRRCRRRHA